MWWLVVGGYVVYFGDVVVEQFVECLLYVVVVYCWYVYVYVQIEKVGNCVEVFSVDCLVVFVWFVGGFDVMDQFVFYDDVLIWEDLLIFWVDYCYFFVRDGLGNCCVLGEQSEECYVMGFEMIVLCWLFCVD